MKIILVNKYATVTGGADRHALDLAALLIERGHDVRLLAFRPGGEPQLPGRYIEPTVSGDTRHSVGKLEMLGIARSFVWNAAAGGAMARLIDEGQPDVVHVHKVYPQLSVSPVVVAASRGVPVIQTAHDYEFISANPADHTGHSTDRTSRSLVDRLANTTSFVARRRLHVLKVDRWIVASEFMKDAYASRGIRAEVLPLFTQLVDAEVRSFSRRRGLVFAGRLDARKGIPDVVQLAHRNPGLQVTIAGFGKLEGDVRRAADELKNLEFVGSLDAHGMRDLYAGARVALVPARWEEPAGLVALEAMLEGTPVVAYATGGLTEYVSAVNGGLMVPQGDINRLSEAAAWLHADQELWTTLSAAGRAGVHDVHAPDRYAAKLEALYSEVVEARPILE